ncbi:MAG TPA: hypothetical protein VNE17_14550 [Nitrolancea sp.]|nr:hypothetical protein [Nitrolancea sp.]
MRVIANIRVGDARVRPDLPSHQGGILGGNNRGGKREDPGYLGNNKWSARRSTSINPENRQPIDPRSPSLPPA